MFRRLLTIALACSAVTAIGLPLAGPARAGRFECPPIKGSANPSDPSHVLEVFTDLYGCEVPLREGIAYVPAQPGDFGFAHILSEYNGGKTNHPTGAGAKTLWQEAMFQPAAAVGRQYECHSLSYRQGKSRRSMWIFIDYKSSKVSFIGVS